MQFEVNDHLAERFKAAIDVSKEDEQTVIDRMFKSYIYTIFSRKEETWDGLEPFLTLPRPLEGRTKK